MSFLYKGELVTLMNYQKVFSSRTVDIQDEVRSAVLDDTQIERYLDKVGEDSYKLSQIRLALREGIPSRYISSHLSGSTLNRIRRGRREGYSLDLLDRYISEEGILHLPTHNLDLVLDVVLSGEDISSIDFTNVRDDLLPLVCEGVRKGYPMWLCAEAERMTKDKLRMLMRGMCLGVDIHPFIGEDWVSGQLTVLFRKNIVGLDEVLKHVNSKFIVGQIVQVTKGVQEGVDVSIYSVVDSDGLPIYNSYQMAELRYGLMSGVDVSSYLNPCLSDLQMERRRKDLEHDKEIKAKRRLGGTIGGLSKY